MMSLPITEDKALKIATFFMYIVLNLLVWGLLVYFVLESMFLLNVCAVFAVISIFYDLIGLMANRFDLFKRE